MDSEAGVQRGNLLQAVASVDRRQSKSGKADQRVQRKKGSKALWVTEKAK